MKNSPRIFDIDNNFLSYLEDTDYKPGINTVKIKDVKYEITDTTFWQGPLDQCNINLTVKKVK